ncbi:MAG: FAD:protein FMN transferase [Planctomycetaceae bacterium]|nr:FAD:protein FMN transferase [Planctomycetaceae bacterium]
MPNFDAGMRSRSLGRTFLIAAFAMMLGYYLSSAGRGWFSSGPVVRNFETMNTYGRITLPEGSGVTIDPELAVAEAEAAVARVNTLMSPFGDASDIKRLNETPAGTWIAVDPLTWRVVMESLRWHRLSGGAFDPTVGPVKALFTFDGRETDDFPSDDALADARSRVGADKLRFEREGMRLSWAADGMRLDLGAIAKGFAADLAMESLIRNGARHALVDIGGELRAVGGKPGDAREPWRAGIRHPRDDDVIERFELVDGAVATSGDYERFFVHDGVRYEHIIDPRTGLPMTEGPASVTVIHPTSCLAADALATTMCVLGERGGEAFLRDQALGLLSSGVRVVMLLAEEGGVRRVEMLVDAEGGVTVESAAASLR